MDEQPPHQPLFARKKLSKKRRSRSTFEPSTQSTSSVATAKNATETSAAVLNNQKTPTHTSSLSLPPLSTRPARSRLRAPPTVPGYDQPAPNSQVTKQAQTSYSAHELNALRLDTASTTPTAPYSSKSVSEPSVVTKNNLSEACKKPSDCQPTAQTEPQTKPQPQNVPTETASDTKSAQLRRGLEIASSSALRTMPFRPTNVSRTIGSAGRPADSMDGKKAPMLSRQADPFSDEWGRGFDDDQPAFLQASIDDDAIQPTLRLSRSTVEDVGYDGTNGSEDNEWHEQLLRRAGINVSEASRRTDDDAFRRDDRIIRDELAAFDQHGQQMDEVDSENVTNIENALSVLHSLTLDLKADCEQAQVFEKKELEQSQKLNETKAQSETRISSIEIDLQTENDTYQFYLELERDLNTLANALLHKREEMFSIRQERIAKLQEVALSVELVLERGEDEFGRVRRPGSGLQSKSIDLQPSDYHASRNDVSDDSLSAMGEYSKNGVQHPLADLNASLRDPLKLLDRFAHWERDFPADYKEALGDFSCGRMVAAVATCEHSLEWFMSLNILQRVEACKVCDLIEELGWTVRARWNPVDNSSCQWFGQLLRAFYSTFSSPDKDHHIEQRLRLNEAIRRRVTIEKKAALNIEDDHWVASILNGASSLRREIEQEGNWLIPDLTIEDDP